MLVKLRIHWHGLGFDTDKSKILLVKIKVSFYLTKYDPMKRYPFLK